MSRTFKDRPIKFSYSESTDKPKKPKEVDTEDHFWSSTPSWWARIMMNRPERRYSKVLVDKVLLVKDLEEVDIPDLAKKPHQYYY